MKKKTYRFFTNEEVECIHDHLHDYGGAVSVKEITRMTMKASSSLGKRAESSVYRKVCNMAIFNRIINPYYAVNGLNGVIRKNEAQVNVPKNKPSIFTRMTKNTTAQARKGPGRPKGSKNKKKQIA